MKILSASTICTIQDDILDTAVRVITINHFSYSSIYIVQVFTILIVILLPIPILLFPCLKLITYRLIRLSGWFQNPDSSTNS